MPAAPCAPTHRSLLPAGVREVEGSFDADDAVEIVDDGRRAVRQGAGPVLGGRRCGRWRGAGPASCPRACPTRSSTATTSSSCPEPGRPSCSARTPESTDGECAAPTALARRDGFASHSCLTSSSSTGGGRVLVTRASTVGEEREEGEAGSPGPLHPSGSAARAGDTASPLPKAARRSRGAPGVASRRPMTLDAMTPAVAELGRRAKVAAGGVWRRRRPPRRTPRSSPRPTCSSERAADVLAANAARLEAAEAAGIGAGAARPAPPHRGPHRRHGRRPARRSPRCPTRSARCSTAGAAPTGCEIERVRVPLGVVAIIYENRPNVTSDAAGICLKSGNAALLRGSAGGAALEPCAVADALRDGLAKAGLPADARPARRRRLATRPRSSSCSSPTSSTA